MTNLTPEPTAPDHVQLTERLQALGRMAVDPPVASAHLTAIAAVPDVRNRRAVRRRFGSAKVAAAFAAGLVLGGTGLATAGALGTTPQNTLADAAGHVGLDLPGGTPRSTEGCAGKTYRNHGQFVSGGGDPHAPCGKPVKPANKPEKTEPTKPETTDGTTPKGTAGAANGCGRPPWAGKGQHAKKTAAAVAARRAACGDGGDTEGDQPGARGAAPKSTTTTTATTKDANTTTAADDRNDHGDAIKHDDGIKHDDAIEHDTGRNENHDAVNGK